MIKLPDKKVNLLQLSKELTSLKLPDFTGVSRLSREVDDQGHAIIEDGAVKKVPPYILVKCGDLTVAQKTEAAEVVKNHISIAKSPSIPTLDASAEAIVGALEDQMGLAPGTLKDAAIAKL